MQYAVGLGTINTHTVDLSDSMFCVISKNSLTIVTEPMFQ